ncbi:MAG: alkanesulfonate monooxygenase SsuD [Candidatus Poriferisodalaceae bacterium]
MLNNEMRNPVQLAWEAATLDRLSQGRFELGLGAGHTPQGYVATGMTMEYLQANAKRQSWRALK